MNAQIQRGLRSKPQWCLLAGLSVVALSLGGCPAPPVGSDGNLNTNTNNNANTNDNGNDNGSGGNPQASKFVGSSRCGECHAGIYESFMQTGHPYKLNEVVDGQPPAYPVTGLDGPPAGLTWDDTAFVIGGFRYKYRVVDNDGYIVLGPTAQFNFPSGAFSGYGTDTPRRTAL